MLTHMVHDLIWLALTVGIIVAFALTFFLNMVIRGEALEAATECELEGIDFSSFVYLLVEVLLGLDSRVGCFRSAATMWRCFSSACTCWLSSFYSSTCSSP